MTAIKQQRAALCLMGAMLGVGCATTTSYSLTASSAVPGATGTVEVSPGDSEDNRLSIQVDNLTDPSKLIPGASAYVVWATPVGGDAAENVGALRVDGRRGSLSTVTSLNDFTISITPEIEAQAIAPSGPEVLSLAGRRK